MRYVDADEILIKLKQIATRPKISEEEYSVCTSVCTELVNKLYNIDYLSWINVKYEMPKERDSIFAKFKGTEKWSSGMFEKCSDNVLVVIEKDGVRVTDVAHTIDGSWSCNLLRAIPGSEIIYWMPFPKPPKD